MSKNILFGLYNIMNLTIFPIPIKKYTGYAVIAGALSLLPLQSKAKTVDTSGDSFVKTQIVQKTKIPHEGSTDRTVLANAPSCKVNLKGQTKNAVIVVQLSTNTLYKYDKNGKPEIAYPIAKGKPSTPTLEGIRIVSHVEYAPYKKAPKHTKRFRNPAPYGKRIIFLDKYDHKTGEISNFEQFIHGTNNEGSIGHDVSAGCMRLPKDAIIYLASQVKHGDVVLIVR